MNEALYQLIDLTTNEILQSNVVLSDEEVETLNYAYALNGVEKVYKIQE